MQIAYHHLGFFLAKLKILYEISKIPGQAGDDEQSSIE
jgi:hypothetical protein